MMAVSIDDKVTRTTSVSSFALVVLTWGGGMFVRSVHPRVGVTFHAQVRIHNTLSLLLSFIPPLVSRFAVAS